jgi:hypothetical protein
MPPTAKSVSTILRDNMARGADGMVQRPLNFAIVDEVDNILIDEARTPLIISAQVAKTDRALRRQQMAKTCDGLARKLVPAVTDREIELLQDSLTHNGRIDIDGLMQDIQKRGAFDQAIAYLVDAYLVAEKSARVDNAAHLLDVADEMTENGLTSPQGRAQLQGIALNAVHPSGLRNAWQKEIARLTEPFATAYTNALATNFDINQLAYDLALSDDAVADLQTRIEGVDKNVLSRQAVAQIIADEVARRGLIEESAVELVIVALENASTPEESLESEKARGQLQERVHLALQETMLHAPGGLSEADAMLAEAAGDEAAVQSVEGARGVVDALEQISLRGLLPFESTEKLWEAVRLTQGREALRREIASAIEKHPGETAQKIRSW